MATEAKQRLLNEAVETLNSAGIAFHSGNQNIHIKIRGPEGEIANLWPTTEKWNIIKGEQKISGIGLSYLMRRIEGWRDAQ